MNIWIFFRDLKLVRKGFFTSCMLLTKLPSLSSECTIKERNPRCFLQSFFIFSKSQKCKRIVCNMHLKTVFQCINGLITLNYGERICFFQYSQITIKYIFQLLFLSLFQDIKVKCVAVINDTVGALMSCAHSDRKCAVGIILGKYRLIIIIISFF